MKSKLSLFALMLVAAQAIAQGATGSKSSEVAGPLCRDKDAPAGCMMMSADEMKAHQEKMRGMKDRKTCMDYMDEHHKAMRERAAKKGEKFSDKPDHRHCMGMGMKGEAKADKK